MIKNIHSLPSNRRQEQQSHLVLLTSIFKLGSYQPQGNYPSLSHTDTHADADADTNPDMHTDTHADTHACRHAQTQTFQTHTV